MRIVVLASGQGSNFEALLQAIDQGRCRGRVVGLATDRARAAALDVAEHHGIPTRIVRPKDHPDRAAWDEALAEAVTSLGPELVVLAGFMRIVGKPLIERFGGRMINVHPSLLPAFPGKDGPSMALEAGVRLSGCTVHLVDEGVDSGSILAQAAVPVLPDDDRDALHHRIQSVEHRLLPAVVDWIARGWLELGPPVRYHVGMSHHLSALVFPPIDPGELPDNPEST